MSQASKKKPPKTSDLAASESPAGSSEAAPLPPPPAGVRLAGASGAPTEVAFAYALAPDPKRPGKFLAVRLTKVMAESAEILEPSGCGEYAVTGLARIEKDMHQRTRRHAWIG